MKKQHLIKEILGCNLPAEEKQALLKALNHKSKDHTKFLIELFKILGISKKVFDDFGIWEHIKKLFEK